MAARTTLFGSLAGPGSQLARGARVQARRLSRARGSSSTARAARRGGTALFRVRNRGQIVGAYGLPDETPGGTPHGLLVDDVSKQLLAVG